jgi:CheY-like chemotaxis protein
MADKKVPHDSILIVDDEIDIAQCIKRFLENYGFHVYAFANPLLALKEFYNNFASYNLIISDCNMKDMTGFEFSESAKERNPSQRRRTYNTTTANTSVEHGRYRKEVFDIHHYF